ncbi:DgyrCDS322 [Dimorphilus gyrociliatus]|uniref:DgyrCDS322 n=1 Tax=Dimorphilus gyrociliatus TaxID=2664684 RepID=A0A7I8V6S6_9ANNE|nr:DgyrCDS322 [Dimorphilus gyrociliatus]
MKAKHKEYHLKTLDKDFSDWVQVMSILLKTDKSPNMEKFETWFHSNWSVEYIKVVQNSIIVDHFNSIVDEFKKDTSQSQIRYEPLFTIYQREVLAESLCQWGISTRDKCNILNFDETLGDEEQGIQLFNNLATILRMVPGPEYYIIISKVASRNRDCLVDESDISKPLSTDYDHRVFEKKQKFNIKDSLVFVYDFEQKSTRQTNSWPRQILPTHLVKVSRKGYIPISVPYEEPPNSDKIEQAHLNSIPPNLSENKYFNFHDYKESQKRFQEQDVKANQNSMTFKEIAKCLQDIPEGDEIKSLKENVEQQSPQSNSDLDLDSDSNLDSDSDCIFIEHEAPRSATSFYSYNDWRSGGEDLNNENCQSTEFYNKNFDSSNKSEGNSHNNRGNENITNNENKGNQNTNNVNCNNAENSSNQCIHDIKNQNMANVKVQRNEADDFYIENSNTEELNNHIIENLNVTNTNGRHNERTDTPNFSYKEKGNDSNNKHINTSKTPNLNIQDQEQELNETVSRSTTDKNFNHIKQGDKDKSINSTKLIANKETSIWASSNFLNSFDIEKLSKSNLIKRNQNSSPDCIQLSDSDSDTNEPEKEKTQSHSSSKKTDCFGKRLWTETAKLFKDTKQPKQGIVNNRPLEDYDSLVKQHDKSRVLIQPVIVQNTSRIEIYLKAFLIGEGKSICDIPGPEILEPKKIEFDENTCLEALDWFDGQKPSSTSLKALCLHPDDIEKLYKQGQQTHKSGLGKDWNNAVIDLTDCHSDDDSKVPHLPQEKPKKKSNLKRKFRESEESGNSDSSKNNEKPRKRVKFLLAEKPIAEKASYNSCINEMKSKQKGNEFYSLELTRYLDSIVEKIAQYEETMKNFPNRVGKRTYEIVMSILKLDKRAIELQIFNYENCVKSEVDFYCRLSEKVLLAGERLRCYTFDKKYLLFGHSPIPKDMRLYLENICSLMEMAHSNSDVAKFKELTHKRNSILSRYCDETLEIDKIIQKVDEELDYFK